MIYIIGGYDIYLVNISHAVVSFTRSSSASESIGDKANNNVFFASKEDDACRYNSGFNNLLLMIG